MPLLKAEHLTTSFITPQGKVQAVRDVSFELNEGEVLGIVGESGSGKSQMMYTIMGLLADNGVIESGKITFDGEDISLLDFPDRKSYDRKMLEIRGNKIAMIFQDPMTFLNPVLKIETQLIEPLMNHTDMTREQARERALELMRLVGIPSPEKRIKQYPFEFSGGMRQRIIIAIALTCNPKLIIADEPTTALDVTIQAQVLELIDKLRKETNTAVIMITHDLGVVAKLCDRVAIMYGGKMVEVGTDREIFYQPAHPYTKGLLSCIAKSGADEKEEELKPIPGSPPDLLNPPKGCPFVDRCSKAMRVCKDVMPEVTSYTETHRARCWLNDPRAKGDE
ncbi:MAG: ABC transporter ATP-binding protein [Erysipelotrichaceae bacterium]|nr:ABC transporter ATP-binding protein [Erysipelotrichaceae bacterium]